MKGTIEEFKGGREEKRNADYGGMVQPSQQHIAPCVKRGWVVTGRERFENSGSVLGRHPAVSSA